MIDLVKAREICDGDWKLQVKYFDPETKEIAQNLVDRANLLPAALDRIEELDADLKQSEVVIEAKMCALDEQAKRIIQLEKGYDELRSASNKKIRTLECKKARGEL